MFERDKDGLPSPLEFTRHTVALEACVEQGIIILKANGGKIMLSPEEANSLAHWLMNAANDAECGFPMAKSTGL